MKPERILQVVVEGLDLIAKLTKTTKDDQLVGALRAIAAVTETLRAGVDGTVSVATVEKAIEIFGETLAQQDARHRDALREKFKDQVEEVIAQHLDEDDE